jgi:excisionase family DNA binding protein
MTLDDDLPPILTVEQTAKVLGISRGLAFTAVRAGDIPSIRIGRRILVLRDRLRQMLGVDPAEATAANQADSP